MGIHRKKWKKEEKIAIVNYAKKGGVLDASKQYNVSHTSIYKWKEQMDSGIDLNKTSRSYNNQAVKLLIHENKGLKNLVADLSLKLQIKEELLKKKN